MKGTKGLIAVMILHLIFLLMIWVQFLESVSLFSKIDNEIDTPKLFSY